MSDSPRRKTPHCRRRPRSQHPPPGAPDPAAVMLPFLRRALADDRAPNADLLITGPRALQ
ncbi:hypothetical protein [Streptomyces bacillaris]|uniref:hypothetical protein n=1 Tax=Streptomyces bacillaris TaxID=68179 RepID=UPI003466325D